MISFSPLLGDEPSFLLDLDWGTYVLILPIISYHLGVETKGSLNTSSSFNL